MPNKELSKILRNPGKMYIQMNKQDLNDFFSKGLTRLTKDKCYKTYNMEDFMKGILEANSRTKTDSTNVHIVDLMLYALAKIEDLEVTINDFERILSEIENEQFEEKNSKEIESKIEKGDVENGNFRIEK